MTISDGEIPEYSLARRGSSKAPWLFTLLALAGAGVVGYVAWDEHARNATLAESLRAASAQSLAADTAKRDLAAKLAAAESEKATLAAASLSKDEDLARWKGTYDQLQEKLKSELKSGDVSLSQDGGKLRVGLVDKVLFNSGEAVINKRGEKVLLGLGAILAAVADKQIQVSGHTDQTPIGEKRAAQFPSNWELSSARAINVVRFLQDKASVPGERLVASGYGEFHPVGSNKTASGRARNRRIEILLTPSLEAKAIGKSKLKAELSSNEPKAAARAK